MGVGWIEAWKLASGTQVLCADGSTVTLEAIVDTGEWLPVFNLRIADHHTYFVGCQEWGFSVWTHNACVVVQQWRTRPSLLNGLNVNHYSIEVRPDQGNPRHTHLEGAAGTPAVVDDFTAADAAVLYRVGTDWTIQVSDTTANALLVYIGGRMGASGNYHAHFNSCAGYIWDVLNLARRDLPDLPAARPTEAPTPADTRPMMVLSIALYRYLGAKTGYTSTNPPPNAPP